MKTNDVEVTKIDLGPKPRLEFHPPSTLIVDQRYQRSVSSAAGKKLIRRIIAEFYWPYFGVIFATDNGDGTFCVIDGQHRAEAARQHPEVHSVPVMVVEEMTLAEQARAFVEINQSRVRLNALQIYRAAVKSGDPVAVDIDRIANECGVIIPANNISSGEMKPGQTLSVKSLQKVYEDFGDARLRLTLKTLMAAYGDSSGDLRSQLIRGVAIALGVAPHSSKLISETLKTTDGQSWVERARSHVKLNGGNAPYALSKLLLSKADHPEVKP